MVRKSGLTSASIVYIDDFGFALSPDASGVDAVRVLGMIQSLAGSRGHLPQGRLATC